ncbi:dipeptidyl peptidase 3, partial [Trichonephila inaurata madagascariensis]
VSASLPKMSDYIIHANTPFLAFDCKDSFRHLSEKEKHYAHYLSKANWMGSLIICLQTSAESPLIFSMLIKIFLNQSMKSLKRTALYVCNFSENEVQEKFVRLLKATKYSQLFPQEMELILSSCLESIYSFDDNKRHLGFPPTGTTTYLSKNFTPEDNEIVTEFLKKENIEVFNSRLFKTIDKTGTTCYEIRLASVLNTDDEGKEFLISESINSHKFIITHGDYSKLLKLVNGYLLLAKEYAANENEVQMIEKYIESFHTGSLAAHKDGSRFWVKDRSPTIES